MQTLLLYLLIMAVIVAAVFAVVWFVFGRGEDLPPVERGTTLTRLPRAGITGADVRSLTFVQTTRGYKQSEVDWALEKVARELDELRAVVVGLQARDANDLSPADAGSPGGHRRTTDITPVPPGVGSASPDPADDPASGGERDARTPRADRRPVQPPESPN